MTYSNKQMLENTQKLMLEYYKRLARTNNTDYKIRYPAENRDAMKATPDYTLLKIRVNKEVKEHQTNFQKRLEKINK